MVQGPLTHSDRYVRKTNRIILIVGIVTLCVFLFGLMLLGSTEEEEEQHYEIEKSIDAETDLNLTNEANNDAEIEFDDAEEGQRPITMQPNPVNMGQIVIGNEATNVLTIGTDGKKAIRIISVELEDAPFEGFKYETNCAGKELRGKLTCAVTTNWLPTVAANVQNNFKIIWHETNVSESNAKHDEVPVFGSAVTKEDCNFCDDASGSAIGKIGTAGKNVRYAIGPDGKVIGIIGEDGIVRDENGREIGILKNGMVVDKDGNIIGVAANGKLIMDKNGNVIGYVDENGIAHEQDGNIIGRMLADGTVVDANGQVIGKAFDYGYVYDDNGNIIGQVLADGTVVDLNGEVIGHMDANGNVVDMNGNIIGHVAKAGEIALDANGNQLGVVMPDGTVVDAEGNEVGYVNENGEVVTKNIIGKRGSSTRLAVDADGNVIGYIDENGNVVDFNGNIVGHVDENGNVVDANGKIIGKASDEWRDLALDENGNVIGYIDEDGIVYGQDNEIIGYVDKNGNIVGNSLSDQPMTLAVDADGNVIGYVDENGNVIDANGNIIGKVDENGNVVDLNDNIIGHVSKKGRGGIANAPVIGQVSDSVALAVDADGNVIGYIDENGNVVDFNGNIIGKVDENGNVIDANGNIIGHKGKNVRIAQDKNGKIIGYVDEKGIVRNQNNEIVGVVDASGNIRSFGIKSSGSLLNRNLIPITPSGKILGEVNNRGEVIKQQKVVGKMRPNGLVTDVSGAKILAKGVHFGNIVNWGCDFRYRLDKDGVVRQGEEDTDHKVFADGTVWSSEGVFLGKVIETGSVYDNQCNYLGEASADGYVRDVRNREIGCLNPDGTMLDLKEPKIRGHLVKQAVAISNYDFRPLGVLDKSGMVYDQEGTVVGCMNDSGDLYNRENVFVGTAKPMKYAYGFDGKLLGMFDNTGNIRIAGINGPHVILGNLIADATQKIVGYALPEVNILYDSERNKIGHLFPDGNIYDTEGGLVDTFNGGLQGIYNGKAARFVQTKQIVDADGMNIGRINYDLNVIADRGGSPIGKSNIKGQIFDDKGHLIGGTVQLGSVRGYSGAYLGSVSSRGEVIQMEMVEDANGKRYKLGEITGRLVPDGHIVRDKEIIGEVIPNDIMVDVMGGAVGIANDHGQVISPAGKVISELLPGGGNSHNYVAQKSGIVIDFTGKIIGIGLPNGMFMDTKHIINGRVLQDGKVVNSDGKFLGEVVSGDIVIGNDDKVKGYVEFDGTIYDNGTAIGRVLTDGLAVDNHNNIIGHTYTIGHTILSNHGEYVGRLAGNGRVIGANNTEIGYLKSNGSFVDMDKKVSGYSLPEVARNRRN